VLTMESRSIQEEWKTRTMYYRFSNDRPNELTLTGKKITIVGVEAAETDAMHHDGLIIQTED
jgi:hypothetical protein